MMQRIEEIAAARRRASSTPSPSPGQSILLNANAPNFGAMYVMLDDFHHRTEPELSGDAIAAQLAGRRSRTRSRDGLVNVFGAPPVEGLGTAGGFKIVIEDRGDDGPRSAARRRRRDRRRRRRRRRACRACSPASAPTRPGCTSTSTAPQAKTMGVSMAEVFNTLQVYLGSLYVNDFNRFGRTWQVNVQADADFRKQIEDLKQLKVRNDAGRDGAARRAGQRPRRERPGDDHALQHVPRGGRSTATPAPGVSSGQAIDADGAAGRARAAPVDALRVDRAGAAAAADRQHGHAASSSWRWCWSSWCWRRSTRAGRCRWR